LVIVGAIGAVACLRRILLPTYLTVAQL